MLGSGSGPSVLASESANDCSSDADSGGEIGCADIEDADDEDDDDCM